MAGAKDYAVLDLQDESDALGVDLQFQGIRTTHYDFGEARTTSGSVGAQHEQTITFNDFPDTPEEELEQEKLLGEEDDDEKPIGLKKGTGFWTFDFYQQFFNVESKQVGDRILWSMVPKPGVSYLQSYIRPNPDLYGPFWICMTLTFTTAITGNLANYLGTNPEDTYIWRYDFHKVTLAATAIFAYAWLVPLAMWGVLVWRGSRAKISLLELLCIYGYSLAIFVPVSILWIVPQPWFKWCLAIVAPILSGSVLVRTVWPSLSHDVKQVAIGIAVFILVLHATLALGFMLYFFSAPDKSASNVIPVVPDKAAATVLPVEPLKGAGAKNDQTPAPTKRQTVPDKSTGNDDPKKLPDGGGEKEKKDVDGDSGAEKPPEQGKNGEVVETMQNDAAGGEKEKKSVNSELFPKKPSEKTKVVESTIKVVKSQSEVKDDKPAMTPQKANIDVKEMAAAGNVKKTSDAVAVEVKESPLPKS